MKKVSPFLGGVLLISGTSIGAGMLALPVCSVFGGFFPSLCIFVILWSTMLATAFFILDVTLSIKGDPNFVSMMKNTLGIPGKFISWSLYLLLLYALLAAYIAAFSPLIASLLPAYVPKEIIYFFLPTILGGFLYLGVRGIDMVNRILMIGLLVAFFSLIGALPPHVQYERLLHRDFLPSLLAAPVIITAFGYHIIIPTLTTYLNHDRKLLQKTLFVGSIIPLITYIVWQYLALGALPLTTLTQAWKSGLPSTEPLANLLQTPWIAKAARCFSFFSIVTSFLGVALSLSDFVIDGLRIKRTWEGKLFALGLTFLPPIAFVSTAKNSFFSALDYAGSFVAILLGILPCLMVTTLKNTRWYQTLLGKAIICFIVIICVSIITVNVLIEKGAFFPILIPYMG